MKDLEKYDLSKYIVEEKFNIIKFIGKFISIILIVVVLFIIGFLLGYLIGNIYKIKGGI